MPAVYDSLLHHFNHNPSQAWRITFVMPLISLIFCGLGLLFLCEDTPMGKWEDRHQRVQQNLESHGMSVSDVIVNVTGGIAAPLSPSAAAASDEEKAPGSTVDKKHEDDSDGNIHGFDHEADISRTEALNTA